MPDSQIEPINDYIEPQLALKAKIKQIEALTLRNDYKAAYDVLKSAQGDIHKLENWLWKNMED